MDDSPSPELETPFPFRCGFAALLGKPNAGKSTLMNALVGVRLAAVSGLPQTTRERLAGIYADATRQIIFVDLPGMTEPTDKLNEVLRDNVLEGLEGVDLVIHLVEAGDGHPVPPDMEAALGRISTPVLLAVNKVDGKRAQFDAAEWARNSLKKSLRERYAAILGVSALERAGLDRLLEVVTEHLPPGPPLYDPEQLTDRDMRYLAQEAIREKAFQFLHEELPYSTAVQIDEFKERELGKWYIRATIYVERDSQKGMVIGKGGAMLKRLSGAARQTIEELCEAPVYLDLWVKVREKWRKKEGALREFGYQLPAKKGKKGGRA